MKKDVKNNKNNNWARSTVSSCCKKSGIQARTMKENVKNKIKKTRPDALFQAAASIRDSSKANKKRKLKNNNNNSNNNNRAGFTVSSCCINQGFKQGQC